MTTLDVLILAAGESKRMTGIKQLLPVEGSTFIERTIQRAIALSPRHIVVVLGAYADQIAPVVMDYPVALVRNPDWQRGMGRSIVTGVDFIDSHFGYADGLLVLLCDQQRLLQDSAYLGAMLAQWMEHPQQIVATRHGAKFGVPALFPAAFMEHLKSLEGDHGARELLNSGQFPVCCLDSGGLGIDINTDEEYRRFLEDLP